MQKTTDLQSETNEAYDKIWFIASVEEVAHTDISLSVRLHIRPGLFVQAFLGERSGALYFALIEQDRRIFGIDREMGVWHKHPFNDPDLHEPLSEGLEPKPLLTFLAQVETLLLEEELL
jgi:hypothetical protein